MKSKFNVLIIGAGKIGAFFDSPSSSDILTHAHAFSCHKGFKLVGFVDVNPKQAEKAAKNWGVMSFRSIDEAFKQESIDIICIATSTEVHYEMLKKSLSLPIKLILLEKPIAKTPEESKKIIKLYNKSKIPIAVNYIRRFLPELGKIKTNIDKGAYGEFIGGSGFYGKGLLNNGSHVIDLLYFFFGHISDFKVIDSCNDLIADDPIVTVSLTFPNKKGFILNGVDSKLFSLFEMDLIFEKQRIRIIESGDKIEFYKIQNNKIFKGYRNMIKFTESKTSLGKYMYYVADNIYKNLAKGEKIKCNIFDGYGAAELCFKILKKQS